MVFPSPGCHTCKRRRIKCDAVRPLCARCRKSDYSCTWDTEDEVLPFRSENAFASGRPRRPRGRPQTSRALTKHPRSNIVPALSLPLELHAVNHWVENFAFRIEDLPDIGHEYSSYVASYWQQARAGSSLHLALLAVAHAVFGRAKQSDRAIENANKLYSQTIMNVKADIKDVTADNIDQLLLTIMLMGSFENFMWGLNPHNPRTNSKPDEVGSKFWQNVCHHKGASGLLKIRRLQGMPPNASLDRVVRRQIIRIIILRGKSMPDWLQDTTYEVEDPLRKLDALMLQFASLRARSLHLFQSISPQRPSGCCENEDKPSANDIAAEAHELEFALGVWSNTVPDDWKFTARPTPAGLDGPTSDLLHDCPAHSYTSYAHAATWNRYRAFRIAVNSIRIRSLRAMLLCPTQSSVVESQLAQCQKIIASLANDLCGGVLFHFNDHNPPSGNGPTVWSIKIGDRTIQTDRDIIPKMSGLLAWPLTVAVSTEGFPEPQRRWLLARMKSVADTLGDRVLESVMDKTEFRF